MTQGNGRTDNTRGDPGLFAIAARMRDESDTVVAAASLAAYSSMISLEEMDPHLVGTVDHISAGLGCRRHPAATG